MIEKMHARMSAAVHLLLIKNDQILLLRRFNTGWQDGFYSLPAGHVDAGESVTAQEPHKCDDRRWYPLEALPSNIIPYIKQRLESYQKGVLFSEHGW
jgi:8-oxo-dGTP pyrophosphatase MutT (NUDIX family)